LDGHGLFLSEAFEIHLALFPNAGESYQTGAARFPVRREWVWSQPVHPRDSIFRDFLFVA
jgi:hypothetical protein